MDYNKFKLYHGISRDKAKLIKERGFNPGTYFTRDFEYSKGFGQVVFTIEKEMVWFGGKTVLGFEIDEHSFISRIPPEEIVDIYYGKHKPKYHNRIDYIKQQTL